MKSFGELASRVKLNLIAWNSGPEIPFRTPDDSRVLAFQKTLRDAGIPAFIRRPRGRDIYEQNLVDRQIFVIESSVHPGNSGGPLVDLEGRAIGVVFAASASQPNQAYALTDAQVSDDIQRGTSTNGAVNVAAYPCAI